MSGYLVSDAGGAESVLSRDDFIARLASGSTFADAEMVETPVTVVSLRGSARLMFVLPDGSSWSEMEAVGQA